MGLNESSSDIFDVVVAGGGVVGLIAAIGLTRSGFSVALIEKHPYHPRNDEQGDARSFAFSLSSKQFLTELGIWKVALHRQSITPIQNIHISNKGKFGSLYLQAEHLDVEALGYILQADTLLNLLWEHVEHNSDIHNVHGSVNEIRASEQQVSLYIGQARDKEGASPDRLLTARYLLLADGYQPDLHEKLGIVGSNRCFYESAIVSSVTTERTHNHTAYERFSSEGLVALLPLSDPHHVGVVYVIPTEKTEQFMHCSDDFFLQTVQKRFGTRFGILSGLTKRKFYPLKERVIEHNPIKRMFVLGNGNCTIHPNGAQGLNLSLRDVRGVLQTLEHGSNAGLSPGDLQLLYSSMRDRDRAQVVSFSRMIYTLSHRSSPFWHMLNSASLFAMDSIPLFQSAFFHFASGMAEPR